MKSFLQHILEAKRVHRPVTARTGNAYTDIGHFKFDDIKPKKGFKSPHYSMYTYTHGGKKVHTQPLTDKITDHSSWKHSTDAWGSGKPYVQGRVDNIKNQISMVAQPVSKTTNPRVIERLKNRIHAHAAEHHPKHKVVDHSVDESLNEAKRSMQARADKLASRMNIKSADDREVWSGGPAKWHFHDRKIAGHDVKMAALHRTHNNRSTIDFTVDDEESYKKVGAKKARRILTHALAFAKRHHQNMGGGDHETEFSADKGSAPSRNPNARANIYRKLIQRAGGESEEVSKGPKTAFRVKQKK